MSFFVMSVWAALRSRSARLVVTFVATAVALLAVPVLAARAADAGPSGPSAGCTVAFSTGSACAFDPGGN